MGTQLEHVPAGAVALFPGATPDAVIAAATEVAEKFTAIVKKQRMFTRIGENDHIHIEAWQTIGSLTGVFADDGHVTEIPWPGGIVPYAEPPPDPGPEPDKRHSSHEDWKRADDLYRRFKHRERLIAARESGQAFGYVASYRTVKGDGGVGWAESQCDRSERDKVGQDNHQLKGMAETRAQSRALAAPLRFVVKLAGFEPQTPEEMNGTAPAGEAASLPWGPIANQDQEKVALAAVLRIGQKVDPRLDENQASRFLVALGQVHDGIPVAGTRTLVGLARFLGDLDAATGPAEEPSS